MFWEEIKLRFIGMREIEPEDLDNETMEDFLSAMDEVSNVLQRVERKGGRGRGKHKHEDRCSSLFE
jgi:hypothetical protein